MISSSFDGKYVLGPFRSKPSPCKGNQQTLLLNVYRFEISHFKVISYTCELILLNHLCVVSRKKTATERGVNYELCKVFDWVFLSGLPSRPPVKSGLRGAKVSPFALKLGFAIRVLEKRKKSNPQTLLLQI
jgi:hypothetical protein